MHADEVHTDARLVRRLLAAQFPDWATLPIEPVSSAGRDNALFRLGDDMVVRLPRRERATAPLEKERRWLPSLAPLLPLSVPVPLAKGIPSEDYVWEWSVYRWLEGDTATIGRIVDPGRAASDLARFVAALQGVDPTDGPSPGEHNFFRGAPLAMRDVPTRTALAALAGTIDTDAATEVWEAALQTSAWYGAPLWIHGDLAPGNLLLQDGQLVAVIDFGCLGVGDPACDLIVAWNLLPADARRALRAELDVDDATWARGRAWALSVALIQLPYYTNTNPELAANARHVIGEVLADHRGLGCRPQLV